MPPSIRDFFDRASEGDRPEIGEAETSANFDMHEVLPFLESLHVLDDIYTPVGRLAFIAESISSMRHQETRRFEAVGGSRIKMHLLTIEVFMDDENAPDITFIGTSEMISKIDAKLAQRTT